MTPRKVYARDLLNQTRTLPPCDKRQTILESASRLHELPQTVFEYVASYDADLDAILRATETTFAVRDRANRIE
jgi:hypothetical protein